MPKDDFVEHEIKKRHFIEYLVTEQELDSIQTRSFVADLIFLFSSIFWSTYIGALIISTTPGKITNTLLIVAITLTLIWAFVFFKNHKFIDKIKKSSGEYLKIEKTSNYILDIKKATYGTDESNIDITELVKSKMENNKLDFIIDNNFIGGPDKDPHRGKTKLFWIEYEYQGVQYKKQFKEHDHVVIP